MILVALPIKLFAFATMNKQGWLTRHAHTVGGDGQTASSLRTGQALDAARTVPAPAPVPTPTVLAPAVPASAQMGTAAEPAS